MISKKHSGILISEQTEEYKEDFLCYFGKLSLFMRQSSRPATIPNKIQLGFVIKIYFMLRLVYVCFRVKK